MEPLEESVLRSLGDATRAMSRANLEPEAATLLQDIHLPGTVQAQVQRFRDMVATTGTDLARNDRDPFGDGDQTPIATEQKCQVFREIWNLGGDISILLQTKSFSPFAMDCILGNQRLVQTRLEQASPNLRRYLLERRESCFRIPPLLLVLGLAKHPQFVTQVTGATPSRDDYEQVVKTLLRFGARPDAKDVAGKTAVHWGAGGVSSPTTHALSDMCIRAARTCGGGRRHVDNQDGRERPHVELHGLTKTAHYNGLVGALGGYDVDKNRCVVHVTVDGQAKDLLLQPKNIRFQQDGTPIEDMSYSLVDVQDRLGSVALHEVVINGSVETARFLCEKHNASVDVAELSGTTPRRMAFQPFVGMRGKAMDVIKKHAARQKLSVHSCNRCNKREIEIEFKRCGRCRLVWYCSRECQEADWRQHKGNCKKEERIQLSRDSVVSVEGMSFVTSNLSSTARGAYRKPDGVNVNERFWIKVQCTGRNPEDRHLVYDKTRSCQFQYSPGPGHTELLQKVSAEKGANGKKTHFEALWDNDDNMIVFPDTAELLDW